MVDLKDRINKPRAFKGTPSYLYVNKLSVKLAFCILTFSGIVGYFSLRNKKFNFATQEDVAQEREEKWLAVIARRSKLAEDQRQRKAEDDSWTLR